MPARILANLLSRIGIPARKEEADCVVVERERDGWLFCLAGPEKGSSWRFDLVVVDPSNFARRWQATIALSDIVDAHRSADWELYLGTFLDGFSIDHDTYEPRFPSIVMTNGEVADIRWHRAHYTIQEFVDGALLFGEVSSPLLKSRYSTLNWLRPADRVVLSKPGASIGSKIFMRMFEHPEAPMARCLAEYWPWMCHIGPSEFRPTLQALSEVKGVPTPEDLAQALTKSGPWPVTPAAVRRYDRLSSEGRGDVVHDRILIDILSSLPASWLAMIDEDVVFLSKISKSLDMISPVTEIEVEELFGGSKGHVVDFARRSTGVDDVKDVDDRIRQIFDLLDFVSIEIVGAVQSCRPDIADASRRLVLSTARHLITPDGNLAHLARKSERWHANVASYPFSLSVTKGQPWPAISETTSVEGFEIRCLVTAAELSTAGDQMHNCLRGYRRRCESGYANILALSREGRIDSIAEVQIAENGAPVVVQHKGDLNADPSDAARKAMKAWERLIARNKIGYYPRERYERPKKSLLAYDIPEEGQLAWRGLIQSRFMAMSWDEFCDEVSVILRQRNKLRRRTGLWAQD